MVLEIIAENSITLILVAFIAFLGLFGFLIFGIKTKNKPLESTSKFNPFTFKTKWKFLGNGGESYNATYKSRKRIDDVWEITLEDSRGSFIIPVKEDDCWYDPKSMSIACGEAIEVLCRIDRSGNKANWANPNLFSESPISETLKKAKARQEYQEKIEDAMKIMEQKTNIE